MMLKIPICNVGNQEAMRVLGVVLKTPDFV
jgi:hypothetical protein